MTSCSISVTPRCAGQRGSQVTRPRRKYASLNKKLERMAGAAMAAPPAAPSSFVTDEERCRMSASQVEFLERKRRAAAGLGPVMPQSCNCLQCAGSGTAVCHQCNGSGLNGQEVAKSLFQNERGLIVQRNGLMDNKYFFIRDGPCWLCRGTVMIGCTDCGGSGMRGLNEFIAD